MIKLIRVDDRLIHGQIITKWIKHYDITAIIAVDDETAKNPVLKSIATMAVPKMIKSYICKTEEARDIVNKLDNDENVMIVVRFPKVAFDLVINHGLKADRINIGNVSKKVGDTKKVFEVTHNIFITDEDIEYLNKLQEGGIDIDFQLLPETPLYPWSKVKSNLK